ncbi:MAG: ATP-grasp domain-containing protein [Planctomycetia bacterium]|nr:ATP-grasp domain-containing protein [Planctomycetia bacterium]
MTSAAGEPLLIVGASARAAAESALRGGYRPYAIDLFADADLAEVAEVRRSRNFPRDVVALARTMPACDWLYVGGLENHPEVVDELAAERRLLGSPGKVLRRVRDPRRLQETVRETTCRHGVSFPESIFSRAEFARRFMGTTREAGDDSARTPIQRDERWLVKRRRSSGGLGVVPFSHEQSLSSEGDLFDDDRYLQRRIEGMPFGAVYLATHHETYLLGLSLQSLSPGAREVQPFRYGGSVGPLPFESLVTTSLDDKLGDIGRLATKEFELFGFFSIDFLIDEMRVPWLLEINPRYTASVELIERARGESLIGLHIAACRETMPAAGLKDRFALYPEGPTTHGKRIVYSDVDVANVPERFTRELLKRRNDAATTRAEAWPDVADIPAAGSSVGRDEPLATVFAAAEHEPKLTAELDRRERELRELLHSTLSSA